MKIFYTIVSTMLNVILLEQYIPLFYKHLFQFLTTKTRDNQKAYIELLESPGDQKNPLHVAAQKVHNLLWIPEIFNTNISHKFFD